MPGLLENDLSTVIPLDGEWAFQLGDGPVEVMRVPGAWEDVCVDRLTDGPAHYRRVVDVPAPDGAQVLFEADAISFAATLRVNGHEIGTHRGLWTRMQFDITAAIQPGANVIALEVWKPGVRHPLRECVAGFLPDVANTFGGMWQSCRLRLINEPAFTHLRTGFDEQGALMIDAHVIGAAPGAVLRVTCGGVSAQCTIGADALQLTLPGKIEAWSPQHPVLHEVVLEVIDVNGHTTACATRRVGRRRVRTDGNGLRLNAAPLHLRGVLDWGWWPEHRAPAPSRAAVHAQFAAVRELGCNLVKLCLFVPDAATFELADEQGMLLWLELPLWLPVMTPESRALALSEYEGILRRVQHHPSIAVVSLGCELDAAADAGLLDALRALVQHWLPGAAFCANSGSAEAYGGDLAAAAADDVYDYHFYCDPHFFQPLIDHFQRGYRPLKPWLFGEFCDADTLRDYTRLQPPPFWLTGPVTMQRDELAWQRESAMRLSAAGVTDGGATLTQLGREQAALTRKRVLETTRRNFAGGGYVLTGWRDTPIATSGLVDDAGGHKFDPAAWRSFNAERVLLVDRERRRAWTNGGDRPSPRSRSVFWSDEPISAQLLLSNGGERMPVSELRWQLSDAAKGALATDAVPSTQVQTLASVALAAPFGSITQPHEATFAVEMDGLSNTWRWLFVPRVDIAGLQAAPALTDEVLARAEAGAHGLVWLREADARFCELRPFVREAIHVLRWQPLGDIDLRPHMTDIATEIALDTDRLAAAVGCARSAVTSLWRRFDARAMTWLDYVVRLRVGAGSITLTTLRHAGGHGDQPAGLENNPLGAWLLEELKSAEGRGRC